ncbi:MAG: hypothetical protein H5U04_02110 [Firmicutes bacterium]|nr:hypothetical protein [Bacillota bacterium]
MSPRTLFGTAAGPGVGVPRAGGRLAGLVSPLAARCVAAVMSLVLCAIALGGLPVRAVPYDARDGVVAAWPPPWGAARHGQPVLLVGSPGTDPEEVWGGDGGLRRDLEKVGFRVWVADLSREDDPDPERLAQLVVGPAAERVLAACGAERLHVVAHGMGALAARYWAERQGRGKVATLVMLAPPNHGSFAMNVLHLAAALSARDAGLVSGTASSGRAAGAAGSAGGNLWAYVWERAGSVYQPLYRRYVREYRLGVPPSDVLEGVKRLLGRMPFEGWLASAEPELFAREFLKAQMPLAGSSVTLAYAHAAALNVARAEELRGAVRGPGLAESVLDDPLITSDWKEMARHYGWKVARWAGRHVAEWLTRQGQKLLLDQAPALLGVDPYSPGAGRVLQEYFSFPLGPGPDGRPRFEQLLGNWFLSRWNGETGRDEGSRYVVVAGRVPNLWRLGWKQVGDNDFWVEVDSCFLPLGPDDRFLLVEDRGVSASHGNLPRNRRVQELVLAELRFSAQRSLYPRAGHPGAVSWKGTRQVPLACWQPGYLRIDSRYLNRPGVLTVELQPQAPTRSGLPVAWAWVEKRDGTWERRQVDWQGDRGTISVPGFGQEATSVLVGGRLPLASEHGVVFAYRKPAKGDLTCRASFLPSPVDPAVRSSPEHGAGNGYGAPSRGSPGRGGDGGTPQGASLADASDGMSRGGVSPGGGLGGVSPGEGPEDLPASFGVEGETALPDDVPVIRATLPTKLTTHKKEHRVRHLRWDWDFGDGTTFVDEDPTHTTITVSHVFDRPGDYTVQARSYGTGGRILREKVWHVRVEPPAGSPAAPGGVAPGPAAPAPPGVPLGAAGNRPGGAGADGGDTVVAGEPWQASLDTVQEPRVVATIDAPREWMSGRPARIQVSAEVEEVPYVAEQRVEIDPGQEFIMIWERAGLFPVRVAVTVILRYRFPETEYTLRNTYLFETWVKVLTTSGTD